MEAIPYLALSSALLALLLAGYFYTNVKAASPGSDRMIFLMNEIEKGARAFLRQEYSWVSIFVAVMAILIGILIAPAASLTYIIGAVLSATAGYAGMTVATMANARTAHAAKDGPAKALPVAFRGGAVMGFSVAGLALGAMETLSDFGAVSFFGISTLTTGIYNSWISFDDLAFANQLSFFLLLFILGLFLLENFSRKNGCVF